MTTADSPEERHGDEYRARAKKATDEAKDVATAGLDNTSDDEIDAIRQRWGVPLWFSSSCESVIWRLCWVVVEGAVAEHGVERVEAVAC